MRICAPRTLWFLRTLRTSAAPRHRRRTHMTDLPAMTSSTASHTAADNALPTDYTNWSRDSLIARLHALEASSKSTSTIPTKASLPQHKSSTFDFQSHPTRHIALKFLYIGSQYNGLEYSGNTASLPTVEEVLFLALLRARLVPPLPNSTDPESVLAWPGPEAINYSKCGRTDKGVSAYDQVIGLTVRSRRPAEGTLGSENWDDEKDELPYPTILNRLLPPTVRVLAWAPSPPENFSARFNCASRTYRYYFTNPMLSPLYDESGTLDIKAMQKAAAYFLGDHDFRNFCKLDASKQITNFTRHISVSRIVADTATTNFGDGTASSGVYFFELRGTAFLWHQVRHMVAILFLVGQHLEAPEIVKDLLDIEKYPTKPVYQMAHERPLVLWRCDFPEIDENGWVGNWNGEKGRDRVADGVFGFWQQARVEEAMMRAVGVKVAEGRDQKANQQQSDESLLDSLAIPTNRDCNPYPPTLLTCMNEEITPAMVTAARTRNKQLCIITGDGEADPRKIYKPIEKRDRLKTVEETNRVYAAKKGTVEERREKRKRKREAANGVKEEGEEGKGKDVDVDME